MRVIQLSDLHIRPGRAFAFNAADSSSALERSVEHLAALKQPPDCVVVSGDLAEHGDEEAYDFIVRTLKALHMPVYVLPGNHDDREALLARMGSYCPADPALSPFLCYTVEEGSVRLVLMDTSAPGRHAGCLHPPVAAWLRRILAERPDTPTLLFTHHTPFLSGMGVMDEAFTHAEELSRILRQNPHVSFCCGHLHRGVSTIWQGVPALICPPLAMRIDLDLSPEGGDAFYVDAPEYLLHHYQQGRVATHFCVVPGNFPKSGPYSFAKPPVAGGEAIQSQSIN